jgi:hypothetical protein
VGQGKWGEADSHPPPPPPPPRPLPLLRLALAALLAIAIGASAPGSSQAAVRCVDGSANEASAAGSDEGPPKFSPAFLRRVVTMEASTDGLSENALPISIEAVCGLPRALEKQGAQLAGNDGIALVSSRTSIWKDGVRLAADRKLVELEGADTIRMRARLLRQPLWQADEDGEPIPTFTTSRVVITD